MQCLYILPAVFFVVAAQEYQWQPDASYPVWYLGKELARERRDVTIDKQILYGGCDGLFGKGGHEHQFFDDDREKLNGIIAASARNWKDPNAAASFDISNQVHGDTSYQAAAGGRWPVGKNGDVSLQGTYERQAGMRREYGGLAN